MAIDPDREVTVFQAVKELLTNVSKHAEAANVAVRLVYGGETVEVSVSDDGRGFDPATVRRSETGGFGLLNVRERLAYAGGHLTVESAPGRGTRSTVEMPAR